MDKIIIDSSETVTSERVEQQNALTPDTFEMLDRLDSALLERMLRTAFEQARLRGHAVLASMTQAITWHDPLDAFAGCLHSSQGESFFWERPAESTALVGVGAATTIETDGEERFRNAAARWRSLMHDAVVMRRDDTPSITGSGPTLFGGFAFDALAPHTDLWRGFPDGLLVLPSLLFSYGPTGTTLTINVMIDANDSIEQCVAERSQAITQLLTSIEHAESHRDEQVAIGELQMHNLLSASAWQQRVADVASEIRAGLYEKVVLARGVQVSGRGKGEIKQGVMNYTRTLSGAMGMVDEGEGVMNYTRTEQTRTEQGEATFDIRTIVRRLRRGYPGAYVFAMQRGERFFVGATPERLVQAQDGNIYTMALAGSARRGATSEEDERIGEELLASEKNNTEHAIVVNQVRDALMQHCSTVEVSDKPHLLKLKNVQHLETPIRGTLLPQRCILDVMADLHPTPAVGGFPRQTALETIRRVEQLDRGWYAGPLGWIGASGYGEFAVALRSGLIDEHEATLFAGCGIVGDSDPQSEYEESCLKLQVMLRSLSNNDLRTD